MRKIMFNSNLSLCGAASGGGYQPEISMSSLFCSAASVTVPEPYREPLGLAVGFGTLDFIGSILTSVPEPTCQIVGHCLSIPSKIIWIGQCVKMAQQLIRQRHK